MELSGQLSTSNALPSGKNLGSYWMCVSDLFGNVICSLFCILACISLQEESVEVAQHVDKLSEGKKSAIKWRKHDSIRCDFRFKARALVTAYEQQDSCGVYHAVQYNLCHMLTWVWRGNKNCCANTEGLQC